VVGSTRRQVAGDRIEEQLAIGREVEGVVPAAPEKEPVERIHEAAASTKRLEPRDGCG
jgi:hypothetical protein